MVRSIFVIVSKLLHRLPFLLLDSLRHMGLVQGLELELVQGLELELPAQNPVHIFRLPIELALFQQIGKERQIIRSHKLDELPLAGKRDVIHGDHHGHHFTITKVWPFPGLPLPDISGLRLIPVIDYDIDM